MKSNASKDEADDRIKELKSKLKNYQELKSEYDLTDEQSTPKAVLRRMAEVLEGYIKLIIQILQPEEYYSLHECTAFDEKDKQELLDLYKSLMIRHRETLKAEITNDESMIISTLNKTNDELKRMKPQMLKIVNKMQESWKGDEKASKARYFG